MYVTVFSPELSKLESSSMIYICRMSDCIVGLRLRVMALIFLFYPFFFLSLYMYHMLTLKICVAIFSRIFKEKNETWYTHGQGVVVVWNRESDSLFIHFSLFYTVELQWLNPLWDQ